MTAAVQNFNSSSYPKFLYPYMQFVSVQLMYEFSTCHASLACIAPTVKGCCQYFMCCFISATSKLFSIALFTISGKAGRHYL